MRAYIRVYEFQIWSGEFSFTDSAHNKESSVIQFSFYDGGGSVALDRPGEPTEIRHVVALANCP